MSHTSRRNRPGHAVAAVLVIAVTALSAGVIDVAPAAAASDLGGVIDHRRSVTYERPVDAPVIDPFRQPLGPYGPGNRGLEYRTARADPVRAIGDGTVVFAGQVAGRLVVSIDHPDGLRSSVVGLALIVVVEGDQVAGGHTVGLAGSTLHLGVRRAGVYLDPASLFTRHGPARLVPWRWPRTR